MEQSSSTFQITSRDIMRMAKMREKARLEIERLLNGVENNDMTGNQIIASLNRIDQFLISSFDTILRDILNPEDKE